MSDFDVTIMFGEDFVKAASSFHAAGIPNVLAAEDPSLIEFTEMGRGNVTIGLAGSRPAAWASRSVEEWGQALLEGTGMGMMELQYPELRLIGNPQDAHSMLLMHWKALQSSAVLRIANAVYLSHKAMGGE